ncbi:MAG: YcxB family protein, partial [Oscillospiraceae bacterium]|nr:YcxB family protein [Oscillospiraceae bacterium]
MEFTFVTEYDLTALTAMARALRKTLRRRQSRRTHVFGWILVVLAVALRLPWGGEPFVLDRAGVITFAAAAAIVVVLLFEDAINGYFARRRMLPGALQEHAVFTQEGYVSANALGQTSWQYDNILQLVQMEGYFVFLFSKSHAQIFARASLAGGSEQQF